MNTLTIFRKVLMSSRLYITTSLVFYSFLYFLSATADLVYVANVGSATVSVIDTASNIVIATVGVGSEPFALAITPDGARVYVANDGMATVSVIDAASNKVIATVEVGSNPSMVITPQALAITPDGASVYVANYTENAVFVIDTANNTVIATVGVESAVALAITSDGASVYVANSNFVENTAVSADPVLHL